MNVLFVEHDQGLFEEGRRIVERYINKTSVVMCSPTEVLEKAQHLGPGFLVILDLDYPGFNCLRLLDELHRKTEASIIVLGSAEHGANRFIKAMKIGAADYLFKPIIDSRLISTIITHVEGIKYVN